MKEIPIKVFARQSLSVMLEQSLYEISLKECNSIMAATVIRDGVTIVSNRRICAGMTIIPEGHLEMGNFVILTLGEEIPYYTEFESSDVLVYLTIDEIERLRSRTFQGPEPGSIPSGPLLNFNYATGVIPTGLTFKRSTTANLVTNFVLKNYAVNMPRFDSLGLYIEPGSTNGLLNSQKFYPSPNLVETISGDWNTYTVNASGQDTPLNTIASDNVSVGPNNHYYLSVYIKESPPNKSLILSANGSSLTSPRTLILPPGFTGRAVIDTWADVVGNMFLNLGIVGIADAGDKFTISYAQLENNSGVSSFIKTSGSVVNRQNEFLTTTLSGVKTIYREYQPLFGSDIIKEVVPYTGELCPWGYLRSLKLWNRELTTEEKKKLVG